MTHQVFIERKRLTVLIGCQHDTIDRMVERELPRPIRLGRERSRYRFIRAEIEPALKQHGIDLAKLEAGLMPRPPPPEHEHEHGQHTDQPYY